MSFQRGGATTGMSGTCKHLSLKWKRESEWTAKQTRPPRTEIEKSETKQEEKFRLENS